MIYHNRCLATKHLIGILFNHKTTVWLNLLFLLLALTIFKVCSIHPASAFEVGQASLVESSAPQWFTKRLTQNVMVWDTEILFRRYVILQVLDLLERRSKEWVVDVGPPRKAFHVYHLESRWRNSHVLVYHSPLYTNRHLLVVAPSTFQILGHSWLGKLVTGDLKESIWLLLQALRWDMPLYAAMAIKCCDMFFFESSL